MTSVRDGWASSRSIMIGMVSLQADADVPLEIDAYEGLLGRRVASVLRYVTWEQRFPGSTCDVVADRGAVPMLVWMPGWPSRTGDVRRDCPAGETGLDEILAGTHDAYIDQFAQDVRRWDRRLLVRFLYEFNASWYVWSGHKNGGADGGPQKVRRAWQYVVGRFRASGVTNVEWVWCAHEPSALVPLEPWNALEHYWPGDEWVDWLGIDGFNFYPENPEREDPALLAFDDCFAETYRALRTLSDKPIQIMTGSGEFTSGHHPTGKAEWVVDMCTRLRDDYEGIVLHYWFHHRFTDRVDWRIDSSAEALVAFREQMQAPWFASGSGRADAGGS